MEPHYILETMRKYTQILKTPLNKVHDLIVTVNVTIETWVQELVQGMQNIPEIVDDVVTGLETKVNSASVATLSRLGAGTAQLSLINAT